MVPVLTTIYHLPTIYHLRLQAMSAREERVSAVGTVVRRPTAEVMEEMAAIAKSNRKRIVAQASPTPTPVPCPGQYSRRPPIRHRARKPINPVPPPSPEEARVAAIRRREWEAGEAHIVEEGRRLLDRPRTPTPPRRSDDPYDLAKWSLRRGVR